jgi:peptide/nickel transport system permease protein
MDWLIVAAFLLLLLVPWSSLFSSKVSLLHQLEWPSGSHWLGTDNLGRDLLVRLSAAVRETVVPLWGGVIVMVMTGTTLAAVLCAGSRKVAWLQHMTDAALSGAAGIPVALFAFCLAVTFETNQMWMVVLSVGLILSVHSFLFLRGLYARSEKLGYWQSHEALGGTRFGRILHYGISGDWFRDLMANLAFYLKVAVTVEASLSYLGFGVQEPQPSFGNMLASHFDSYMRGNWLGLVVITAGLVLCASAPSALVRICRSGIKIRTNASATASFKSQPA